MIREIRKQSGALITIGACATAGGIQALRNWKDVKEFIQIVYATPEYISTLLRSLPVSSYVKVDYELRGCPINKYQLVEVINAFLNTRKPNISSHSVCMECKIKGNVCVMVAHGTPCLGPVTHAGCSALCPSFNRGCYGCFGPMDSTNTSALSKQFRELGESKYEIMLAFRGFNAYAEPFRKESEANEKK
jgi:coenzyme F420-reducing hydrogenase gamma subunit